MGMATIDPAAWKFQVPVAVMPVEMVGTATNARCGTFLRVPCYRAERNAIMSTILKWALIMLVVSLVAALFGFTGLSAASADIARILFYIFIIIFLVLLVLGLTVFRAARGP